MCKPILYMFVVWSFKLERFTFCNRNQTSSGVSYFLIPWSLIFLDNNKKNNDVNDDDCDDFDDDYNDDNDYDHNNIDDTDDDGVGNVNVFFSNKKTY